MHPSKHFCCQNPTCSDFGIRAKENLRFSGWSGKGKCIRMIYCKTCKTYFSERKGTVLEQARLPVEKVVSVLQHIQEGCGSRATGRLVKVERNTVTRYIRLAGVHSKQLHDELVAFSPSDQRNSV